MFGQHVNSLNIYVKTTPLLGSPVFTKKNTQGNVWKQAQVSISPTVNYQVIVLLFVLGILPS